MQTPSNEFNKNCKIQPILQKFLMQYGSMITKIILLEVNGISLFSNFGLLNSCLYFMKDLMVFYLLVIN